MSRMSSKLYKDSPTLERDKEDGKMKAKKGPSKDEKESSDTNAGVDRIQINEGMPPHVRHSSERRDIHNRHETEHAVHDTHHPEKPKHEMHARHIKELQDMHKRHEAEGGDEKPKKPQYKVERG